ncbi:MAG: GrdX family protein [Clostridiaceae bacterium]|nr:GrdX family protein [Clostridiaceae bacterium]
MLKNDFRILTNNSLVKEKYSEDLNITFIDGQYIDVIKSARDMVHKGLKLITHPLMGSIKPNETPFRSIIISEGTVLDVESLTIIESSIVTAEKFQRDNKVPVWNEKVLDDFRFIDLRLFESALESIEI